MMTRAETMLFRKIGSFDKILYRIEMSNKAENAASYLKLVMK